MKIPKIKIKFKAGGIDPTALSEHEEQVKVIAYCRSNILLKNVFAIPNGGKRSMVAAMRAQAEGLCSGVPDLFIPFASAGYHGLFIEMKKLKGGVVSATQKEWIAKLNASGYKAVVCKGHQEAIAVIEQYIGFNR
jgi:hypothetical protein